MGQHKLGSEFARWNKYKVKDEGRRYCGSRRQLVKLDSVAGLVYIKYRNAYRLTKSEIHSVHFIIYYDIFNQHAAINGSQHPVFNEHSDETESFITCE